MDKIQTDFAENIVKASRSISKRESARRPKWCTAPKMCAFIACDGGEGFCAGIWNCKDEDMVRFCIMNKLNKRFWMWITPNETVAMSSILTHAAHYCMATGIPELDEVLENFGEHLRQKEMSG